tara:strand:- start:1629 stop:2090 length:462 start_codon:yes stop_codon:yes gene_type:complete
MDALSDTESEPEQIVDVAPVESLEKKPKRKYVKKVKVVVAEPIVEPVPEPVAKPVKVKKVATQKQLDALTAARAKRAEARLNALANKKVEPVVEKKTEPTTIVNNYYTETPKKEKVVKEKVVKEKVVKEKKQKVVKERAVKPVKAEIQMPVFV